ncbi:MAG: hypothetical protein JNM56_07785 [Planctomycetia bacterium]|nr:hypothetical protein [Planctomycetia bacterium]
MSRRRNHLDAECWSATVDLTAMLRYLRRRAGARKWRLFVCAVCRRLGPLVDDAHCQRALRSAELFADGMLDQRLRAAACQRLNALRYDDHRPGDMTQSNFVLPARWYALQAVSQSLAFRMPPDGFTGFAARAVAFSRMESGQPLGWLHFQPTLEAETRAQCDLLRHLAGNPFQATWPLRHCPTTVASLAEALYHGEDCAFALHDALWDAGQARLAQHFAEPDHPKGCWALDLLLGKE